MSTHTQTLVATGESASLRNTGELLGRVMLAVLFLMSGLGKVAAYTATAGYMHSVGVPGVLLPLVILTEVGGALAVIAGWKTRIVSLALAGFTLLTAFLFHTQFADQVQMIMFMKNISIAGAFLMLASHGAGRYSLDGRGTE
ncbi:DoxX family protein [Dyella psychrodurans]|uniref:DoxX family protein n=1 Tax=Dyella psychrodurans TaxID=1927960 RepID=A0A370XCF3_9GAMM|nr:DoxX family protein [Dyella psychrodurans]RDS86076.1 DoxX family protein [Dyella psychrodurans]